MRSSNASLRQSLKPCGSRGTSRENRAGRPSPGWRTYACVIRIVMRLAGKLLPVRKNFCCDIEQEPGLLPCLLPSKQEFMSEIARMGRNNFGSVNASFEEHHSFGLGIFEF